jgi:hypothetical protein
VNPSKVQDIFPTLTLASSSTARDSSSYSCKQDDVVLLCSAYVVLVRLCDGDGDGDGLRDLPDIPITKHVKQQEERVQGT